MKILVLFVLTLIVVVLSSADDIDKKQLTDKPRTGKLFGGLLFGGGRPRCPVPRPVCPYDCGQDPAVVHGYCCGCAAPFDYAPIKCPPWLQCPIQPEPLCSDYRFVMDCCCQAGTGFPFFK